jgi:hypothetical protein
VTWLYDNQHWQHHEFWNEFADAQAERANAVNHAGINGGWLEPFHITAIDGGTARGDGIQSSAFIGSFQEWLVDNCHCFIRPSATPTDVANDLTNNTAWSWWTPADFLAALPSGGFRRILPDRSSAIGYIQRGDRIRQHVFEDIKAGFALLRKVLHVAGWVTHDEHTEKGLNVTATRGDTYPDLYNPMMGMYAHNPPRYDDLAGAEAYLNSYWTTTPNMTASPPRKRSAWTYLPAVVYYYLSNLPGWFVELDTVKDYGICWLAAKKDVARRVDWLVKCARSGEEWNNFGDFSAGENQAFAWLTGDQYAAGVQADTKWAEGGSRFFGNNSRPDWPAETPHDPPRDGDAGSCGWAAGSAWAIVDLDFVRGGWE